MAQLHLFRFFRLRSRPSKRRGIADRRSRNYRPRLETLARGDFKELLAELEATKKD
jgi:hypothetical protein